MTNSILLTLLMLWATCCAVHSQTANQIAPGQKDLEKSVKEAFAEYEKTGNAALLLELPRVVGIIQYLETYSKSGKPSVREQVIGLTGQIKADEAIPLLVRGVADSERRNAEIASEILFKNYSRETLVNNRDLDNSLSKSGINGNNSIAFYPLLGYFPTAANQKIIGENCEKLTAGKSKLDFFDTQKSLVACVVRSGIGTEKGARWIEKFRAEYGHSFYFLLANLNLIEDPNTLKTIFNAAIIDDSPLDPVFIEFGVPHPNPKYEPRLLDLAVNKYAERLKINLGFKLEEAKRYSKTQVFIARRKILVEIMRLKN